MDTFEPTLTLKLSIQTALLQRVTNRLVSLTCVLKGRHIQIRAYFSPKATDEGIEDIQRAGAEVIADFPDGYTIEGTCESINESKPQMLDFWAFMRKPD